MPKELRIIPKNKTIVYLLAISFIIVGDVTYKSMTGFYEKIDAKHKEFIKYKNDLCKKQFQGFRVRQK